jgi:hypothetical protein
MDNPIEAPSARVVVRKASLTYMQLFFCVPAFSKTPLRLLLTFVARCTTMLDQSFSALGILTSILVIVQVLVSHVRNPLRKVPAAHPLAHFTSLWIHSVRWRGIENATLKAAHDRLGPIVCLGPNEISVGKVPS